MTTIDLFEKEMYESCDNGRGIRYADTTAYQLHPKTDASGDESTDDGAYDTQSS